MNKIKNVFIYTGVVGGGSVSLSYFLPEFWQPFAIAGLMFWAIVIGVYDFLTDGESSLSFQNTQFYRANPEGTNVEVEKNESSGIYFAVGVWIFGTLVLAFIL